VTLSDAHVQSVAAARQGAAEASLDPARASVIFEPLRFRNLEVKNRVFRSRVAGRFDNYDGSGTEVRINWDLKFARGGVGTIISSNAPIDARGHIIPGYAYIDSDDTIPFWRTLGERVHEHDCKYVLQLVFAGRERMMTGVQRWPAWSSSDRAEPINGFPATRMTVAEIRSVVRSFADSARRAREAGLDGVELAGANGMLFTQFLSSAINDRDDDYGGSLENRARFSLEVVRAIRAEVGDDFFVGFKISPRERMRELLPWLRPGNTLEESIQVCRWLEEAGIDMLHVSTGGGFPHPRNPAGRFPAREMVKTYDALISDGRHVLRNFLIFSTWPFSVAFRWWWERPTRSFGGYEGINLADSRAVKRAVGIPVLCTGGFQTASVIAEAISSGACDGVTIARPLVANPDLVRHFEAGRDTAPRPCTYCNKCLFNFVENPLGCYEEARFDSREEMLEQIFSVYGEPSFLAHDTPVEVA
jgi:2,4-dienoyl-CoA reductase-like NADH-dependent reductase (Old Yellow Enzyme family)